MIIDRKINYVLSRPMRYLQLDIAALFMIYERERHSTTANQLKFHSTK